jgi:predicted secreted protein
MRARSVSLVTLLAVVVVGYDVGRRSPAAAGQSAPSVITESHSGKTFSLKRGSHSVLRLSNTWNWTQPKVRGGTVALSRINYESDPGFKAWQITRRSAGAAKITAYGRPNCDGCSRSARSFSLKLNVR